MIKAFFQNSLIYTIGTIFTRGIGILLLPIYTRYLTPGEYGIVDLFMILGSIVGLTIALEIFQAVARFYPEARDNSEKMQYVSTAFWFTVFIYILYFIFSFIYAEHLTLLLLDDLSYLNIFYLATAAITTSGIFYFTSNQLKWQMQPKDSVIVSIINLVIVALIAIYLLVIVGLKVESIFIGQIVGNSISSLVAIYYAKENYKLVFIYTKFKEMLELSFPLVFSGIAIFIALFIDRIFIKELLGLTELGIYGVAYKFAAITSLVMIGFQSSLMPLVYRHYKEVDTPKNIAKLFSLFSVFALFVVMGSMLFSKELVIIMSRKSYYEAAPLIPLLVMAVFLSNMYIFAPGLGIAKKTKIVMIISFISAMINTGLNFLLIPIFGLKGAAVATMISAFIIFFIRLKASNKYYYIPYAWYKLIIGFGFTLIFSYLTATFFVEITVLNFIIKSTILLIMTYSLTYLLVGQKNINIVLKKIRIVK